ncbi:MAG: hypothetical protein GTO14_23915, partial [Anaerolineales bacterium]|nr:hypothetical protein [Anaerolineales bacterium]
MWDSNFKGIWHLKEEAAGTGTADLYKDSTSNANHGDDNVSATGQEGQIAGGQQFDGTVDRVLVPDPGDPWEFADGGLDAGTSDFTITAWVLLDPSPPDDYPTIVSKGGGSDTNAGYWFDYHNSTGELDNRFSNGTTRVIFNSNPSLGLNDGQWHHVAMVLNREPSGDTATFYVDGGPAGSEAINTIAGTSVSGDEDFAFGARAAGTRPWKGNLDEVRISNFVRSACWIQTEFNNQKYPNKAQYPTNGFITVDPEVSLNSAPSAPTEPYSNNDTAQSGQTNPIDITDPSPAFSAIYEDPDPGDTANKYRVEVNTQSDFNGTVMWDSGAAGTSMADTTEGNRSPDIIYAGSPLADSTTYYWRITFWDNHGAEGAVSATQQFTTTTLVNAAPNAPTTPYSNNDTAQSGQPSPATGITDPSPAFSAIYEDDPGDTANKYRVEVNTQSDFAGTVMWDSGASGTTMANTTAGNRCPDIIYAGSALADSTTYYWRITFWDDDGLEGAVSATQQFTTTTVDTYSYRKQITIDSSRVVVGCPNELTDLTD